VGASGAIVIVHDMVLHLLNTITIISLLEIGAITAVLVLSQVLIMSMVAAVISIVGVISIVAIPSIIVVPSIVVAMMIVPIVMLVQASAMAIALAWLAAAVTRAAGLGAQLLQHLLLFLLLELVEDATCLICILTMLKEADEWDVVVRKHLVHYLILLLVLLWH
jgi:hypothetical protein